MFSIIIPFKHIGDRTPLFKECIKRVHSLIKGDSRFELCVHESGPVRWLTKEFLSEYNIRYLYSRWEECFHRSWNLNVSARYLATKETLVFLDADLLVDETFIQELINNKSEACWGWNKLIYLSQEATKRFLHDGSIIPSYRFERCPEVWNCAGGINVIKRKTFFGIGGWPEDFRGVYGGPDNLFAIKQARLGLLGPNLNCTIYHLDHEHKTHPELHSPEHERQKQARMNILKHYDTCSLQELKNRIACAQGFGDISLSNEHFIWGLK